MKFDLGFCSEPDRQPSNAEWFTKHKYKFPEQLWEQELGCQLLPAPQLQALFHSVGHK